MSKITYADKVALNENPSVADVNKVKADDLNEIKNVVNENDANIMKINDKLLNIDYNEIKNKPIIYEGWSQSVSFELPSGRQAIVMDGIYGVLLIWNPPDKVNSAVIYGNNIYNVSRASNNTTITVSKSENATWSVFILK